jgi:hypothetical protein
MALMDHLDSEDAMVFVRLPDERQPDKHHGIFRLR